MTDAAPVTIDLSQTLLAPDGQVLKDADGSGGFTTVSLASALYIVLIRTTVEVVSLAQVAMLARLAGDVVKGGEQSFTGEELNLMHVHLAKAPLSIAAKAAVLKAIDPAFFAKFSRTEKP